MDKVRLDKWLWAARFFKSRSLAKQAIEGGKVHYDGARVKVSKEVLVGAELRIRQGWDEKTIEVVALSDQRRSAPQAHLMYQETEQSITQREQQAAERKAAGNTRPAGEGRPNKRNRRLIHRFKQEND
jgi:ribosome-associated heat shock protein Hsp15